MSILAQRITDTPIAVIDLETTGLSAKGDRVVEIAVVRVNPGEEPRVVLDTLVNPQRRVSCSEIHGIYDDDVVGAPLFRDLEAPLAAALDGAVVASFNVYFDMRFVEEELTSSAIATPLPHLCLMWLRPALGLGARASLGATCSAMGITFTAEHRAATDALASAKLWSRYVEQAQKTGVVTFADLTRLKSYKFMQSWDGAPFSTQSAKVRPMQTALKPRRPQTDDDAARRARNDVQRARHEAMSRYWDEITTALVDREITAAELDTLRRLQAAPALTVDALRFVHGRVLAGLLNDLSSDQRIDDAEAQWVDYVARMLAELGWAPGVSPLKPAAEPARVAERPSTPPVGAERAWWGRIFGGG